MNLIHNCIIVIVIIISNNLFGQNESLKEIEKFPLAAEAFVGIDKFENLYYLDKNTIFKLDDSGEIIAFKDVLLGDIDRVDILNPNKIIVFYKMSNTVVILDNRMTEIKRQDFNRISPFKNISLAGTAKDQGLWIYNIDLNQLELYDYRYNRSLAQSLPIDQDVLDIKNNFNFCFLKIPEGILVFNIYGSLVKKILVDDVYAYDLYKNNLIVHTGNLLKIYDENFKLSASLEFNTEAYKNFFYKDENLYLYDGKSVSLYSIISKK